MRIKILLAVSLIFALLSGCTDSSVGIIGGADGPTAVLVTGVGQWSLAVIAAVSAVIVVIVTVVIIARKNKK